MHQGEFLQSLFIRHVFLCTVEALVSNHLRNSKKCHIIAGRLREGTLVSDHTVKQKWWSQKLINNSLKKPKEINV